ncbi:Flp family type IVb pilin [Gluconacetobacter tumulicola]|uniref:Flp family type IVb pilin n=1 Tax=Gluconacetobacter tumulicola TaxID=1017177 RepID=A0A7W4P5N0_9PROT|nr:Flp family type IVb pilin [Gluconacetobacter tumulicola]MBB2178257.1 Flp family type IVb pilin [Gluconacetobacter tumulicola]
MRFMREIVALKCDRRGVTMLEYGLIAALVAVVAITALTTLGKNLGNTFNSVASQLPTTDSTTGTSQNGGVSAQ